MGRVNGFRVDTHGALWAATEGGLSRIEEGRIATLTSQNGLPCNNVDWVMEDDERSFWLNMDCALVRIPRVELDSWVEDPRRTVHPLVFDSSDGVRSHAFYGHGSPRVGTSADGRIWFSTWDGLGVIDPRRLPVNELPPPVHVEKIVVDDEAHDVSPGLRLPPRSNQVEIDYTALSFVAPEKVRFRFRLEGRDRGWQEAGTRRQAFYNDLPPGAYRFRVIACNNSGVWNEEGASLDFTIAPAYHQTIAFRALAAAALLALLWAAYRLRVRVVERHAAEISAFNEQLMKAQEQERTRIAGELHDSVMQQISALSLVLGTARRKIASEPEAKQMIAEVQRKLIDVGSEIRQLSHDLYPPMLEEAGLPEVLRGYCDAFGQLRGIPISCDAEESLAELSSGTALALYRIAQEALGNAAKHAAPTRVDVRLVRTGGNVVLTVADDGRGCEPGQTEGGLGLVNMRERARQLGGTFELDSRPGRGTTVRVALPFRIREAKSPEPTEARRQ
jgi:signal transduction histidine kinase